MRTRLRLTLPLGTGWRALPLAAALAASAPSIASGGGFYHAPRGTGPLARAGAFVAGADDPHALWYNPAGLSDAGQQVLVDATLTLFSVDFTRIDSGGNRSPTATGTHNGLPSPTLAASFGFDAVPDVMFGVMVAAPNAVLLDWDDSPESPPRYGLITLDESLLAVAAAGVAWRPTPRLSIGVGGFLLFGQFNARLALSACDGFLCSFPEDPSYDAVAQLSLSVLTPFATFGLTLDFDSVRIGVSAASPFRLSGQADLTLRPPTAPAYADAVVVNRRPGCPADDATASCRRDTVGQARLQFPWILRLGVELRPLAALRVELAAVYETWSMQRAVTVTPTDMWIEGALGGGLDYQIGEIEIPRNMQDTWSVRLGGEYRWAPVRVRLGVAYESDAFDDAWRSTLTIDSDKVLAAAGAGVALGAGIELDATFGFIWYVTRNVADGRATQTTAVRPPASEAAPVAIGNGRYEARAPFLGLGLRGRFD